MCVEVRIIRVFRSKRTITKDRTRFEWQLIMRRAARPAPLMQLRQLLRRLMGQPESLCHSRLGVRGQLCMSKIRLQEQQGFAWVAAVTVVEHFWGRYVVNFISSIMVGTELGIYCQASWVKPQHQNPTCGPPVHYVPLYVGHDLPPPPQQPLSLKQTGRLSSSSWL